jgi:hypothetical protein
MTQETLAWRRPIWGQANQTALDLSDALAGVDDVGLVARKGLLYALVCAPGSTAFSALARRYYVDPSYDILPTLARALSIQEEADASTSRAIALAIVVCGLDLYCVGTADVAVWLVRGSAASPIAMTRAMAPGAASSPPANASDGAAVPALHCAQRRLGVGDVVIATLQPIAQPLSLRALARIANRGGSMSAVARAVARLAARGERHALPAPVIALRIPGFEAIPDMGPVQKSQPLPVAERAARPRQAHSPIWIALAIAILAIVASIRVSSPSISPDVIDHVVMWLLTPAPTRTATGAPSAAETIEGAAIQSPAPSPSGELPSAAETGLPNPTAPAPPSAAATPVPTRPALYPLSVMVYPSSRERICERPLRLRWSWLGILAQDEYYDVRLWRVGEPEKSVAWTVDQQYELRGLDNGWHYWRVVVIRGRDGVLERELSGSPTPISFLWECDEPIPTPLLRAPR